MADTIFDFSSIKKIFCQRIEKRLNDTDTKFIEDTFNNVQLASDLDKKACCDQAFKECLQKFVVEKGNDDMVSAGISIVRFAIACAKNSLCTSSTAVLLLADLAETLTIDRCLQLFSFVEESVPVWTSDLFFSTCKNHLLRMCNDILRRLSKSQNTVFCGRIQLFLARLFPLEEKSALNLMSHFNLENVTIFKKKTGPQAEVNNVKDDGNMEAEEGELPTSNPIDFGLYVKLWSMQDFFSNPSKCYTPVGWRALKMNTTQVLKTLSSHKLEHVQRRKKGSDVKENLTITDIIKEDNSMRQYFPKFLTNENLMDLQLNDSNFRRHILVQCLILFQFLNANTKPNQTLSDLQQQWLSDTRTKVVNLLTETPPDGDAFVKTVLHILNREENWMNWKNEGCPSFARVSSSSSSSSSVTDDVQPDVTVIKRSRKRSIGEELAHRSSKKLDLGSQELSRLWNICPDNLEACKAENRTKFLPSLPEFFEEAIEQTDPEAGIEDEYKLVNKSEFGWRALRLLARRSCNFFTPSNQPFKPLSDYLTNALTQVTKDINTQKSELH
eukprot:gene5238-5899_t